MEGNKRAFNLIPSISFHDYPLFSFTSVLCIMLSSFLLYGYEKEFEFCEIK